MRELHPSNAMWALAQRAVQQGQQAGLAAVGIAPATPMDSTRRVLEERKRAGLSGGMQFTYRNPARSTDPSRALPGAAALVVGAWPYGPEGRGHAGEGRLAARCRPAGAPGRGRGPRGRRAVAGPPSYPSGLGGGWLAMPGKTTTRACEPPWARWQACWRLPGGVPGYWLTTTLWWTGPPPIALAWAGSARTATSCSRGEVRGSCWAQWPPTLRCPPGRRSQGRAALASTACRLAPRAPLWHRAPWTPASAWPGCSSARACSRGSTGRPSGTVSTVVTTARTSAR